MAMTRYCRCFPFMHLKRDLFTSRPATWSSGRCPCLWQGVLELDDL